MNTILNELKEKKTSLGVLGLGYVGLPLAHAFAKLFKVIGYDCNESKIALLKRGIDPTCELPPNGLKQVTIEFSTNPEVLKNCRFIVAAVPTPVDKNNRPDLQPLIKASEAIGKNLSKGSLVVYESTVYPGLTREICLPILERESGLKLGVDFKIGYSPERINPGDKEHRLETLTKVVSGSDPEALEITAAVYGSIIKAGIHKAPTIEVAEAAKVIENTQRDLNIALMNELAIIFHKLGIDTRDVLAAAGTKWNFLKFVPGLVGGHCIGVDPYYLTFKAEEIGYHPEVILAGRRINDSMGEHIATAAIKNMIKSGKTILNSDALILGLTFKENVADLRNSKVVDIIHELNEYGVRTTVHDPLADTEEAKKEYDIEPIKSLDGYLANFDVVILAVSHEVYKNLSLTKLASLCRKDNGLPVLMDVKAFFDPVAAQEAGFRYWRL